MEITTKQLKRCDLVKATSRIDSYTAPRLAESLDTITEADRYNIVLDMSEVEFISSAGVRVLINTQKTCKRWNRGRLVLLKVPQRIYEALDLGGLLPIFTIYDDDVEAVGSF